MAGERKVRIVYHSNCTAIGGADLYLKCLIEHTDPEKCEVILYAPGNHPFTFDHSANPHVRIRPVGDTPEVGEDPGRKGEATREQSSDSGVAQSVFRRTMPRSVRLLIGTFRDALAFSRHLREDGPDLFHSNEGGAEPALIGAAMAGVGARLASYCVLPTLPVDALPGERARKLIEKLAVRGIHKGIVKSESSKQLWVERLKVSPAKLDVVYNGLDMSRFNRPDDSHLDALRRELGLGSGRVVGVSARLHPMKGHVHLLDAAPAIIKAVPDVKFLFVGEGPLRGKLEALVNERGLSGHVAFLGFRTDVIDVTWLYDLAVLPSVAYESHPWAAIEAMACEKALVASDFDGFPETVDHGVTGLLFPPGDSGKLAATVTGLLSSDEQRRSMGSKGRQRVAELFTEERMLKRTFSIYKELLRSYTELYRERAD